jgi:hypothetical protein
MRKVIIAAVMATVAICSIRWYFTRGDTFHRPVFEAVISKIRKAGLPAGTVTEFKLDDLSNPNSLRPVKLGEVFPGWHGAGVIAALPSSAGDLKVVIRTRDNWHFGQGGFAYSDTPMTPEQDDEGKWFLDGVPGLSETKPDLKIDEHWWRVEASGD